MKIITIFVVVFIRLCMYIHMYNHITVSHDGRDSVSNHQPHDCLLNRLFRRRSKKTSKLRVTGPCVGNSPGTGEFPAQMASNTENFSIWWRHHDLSQIKINRIFTIFDNELINRSWNETLTDRQAAELNRVDWIESCGELIPHFLVGLRQIPHPTTSDKWTPLLIPSEQHVVNT